MRDVEVQKMMDSADALREDGKYKEAIQQYIDTMKLAREDWREGIRDELWQKKVISMACNGMGIAYAKLGKPIDTIENFQDAIKYAPSEEAKNVAIKNLEKYKKALIDKMMSIEIIEFDRN